MKKSFSARFALVALSSSLAFIACGGDDDDDAPGGNQGGEPAGGSGGSSVQGGSPSTPAGGVPGAGGGEHHGEGSLECEVLGELCHEADTGSGAAHECHLLGHEGDPDACSEGFADCIDTCVGGDEGAGGAGAGGAPAEAGDPKCRALGELCHAVDDGDGPLHECHHLGHVGEPSACAEAFDECAMACLEAREALEEGAGGAGAGGAGAGGAAAGGATGELGGAGGAQ